MKFKLLVIITNFIFCSSEIVNQTKNCADNSGSPVGDVTSMFLLNRINEQLTSVSVTSENIIRKLENIDSRLTKLEPQTQHINENFQIENKHTKSRIENNDRSTEFLKQLLYSSSISDANYRRNIKNSLIQFFENSTEILSNRNPQNKMPAEQIQTLNEIKKIPLDCSEIRRKYGNMSGVYDIQPPFSPEPISVNCVQGFRGGGWTEIQYRKDGSLDFYRTWQEYKEGFGDPHGEHWLGLENIHLLTSHKINEVYFELKDFNNNTVYAHYDDFAVGPESSNYAISFLGTYEGTAGDSFSNTRAIPFSTPDRDNDSSHENCALKYSGAWWHQKCFSSNLNGNYTKGTLPKDKIGVGIIWDSYKGYLYSLKSSRIMVRPRVKQVTGI